MKKNKQNIVAFPGDEEDMMYLRDLAESEDRSVSWMIREAIREYVNKRVEEKFND